MRFCNGIPNDRYRIVADENRWQVGYASPFRDGRGGNVFRPGTAAHGWRALTFPPAPFLSPAGGEEGGGRSLTFPPAPFLSPAGGEEGGGRCLPFPLAPFLSPAGGEEGGGRSLSFPWPPSSPTRGAEGGRGGLARKHGGPRTQ